MMTWQKFSLNFICVSAVVSAELGLLSAWGLPTRAYELSGRKTSIATSPVTEELLEFSGNRVLLSQQEIPNNRWNSFEPPQRGTPGRRDGGGTRPGIKNCPQKLIALVPESAWGGTTASQPTLFYYVADSLDHVAEFVLWDEAGNEKIIHFQLKTKAPGIIGIELSKIGLSDLAVNQYYGWFFSIQCGDDDDPTSAAGNPHTTGWIKRVPDNYSGNLWYDELLRRVETEKLSSQRVPSLEWSTILEEVGLGQYAQQPFINTEISSAREVKDN